ncbi:Holo-[acyl-carrier-protein] synthase [Rubripirellula tenax]|uniref:Holo-[acyl-carrier-protein] synthase n=1 Tax=Rubripirellula tenax TaxID=2528015 RepID=A0A5C6EGL9_9BACT|nr:holo-ACP synthase [Rubripirellula tenax]TWU47585.1 Holo-[acyl-carrier-protein] synthase [Rubripirellula tenax]
MPILGTGTEIVECVRIAKMIEAHAEQFLERVYTANEIAYCIGAANATQHFAKRWAAKEATMKAMRCRNQGVRWTEIEIDVCPGEGPTIVLAGSAAQWAEQVGIEKLHVSLGACRTHATAYVLATDELE